MRLCLSQYRLYTALQVLPDCLTKNMYCVFYNWLMIFSNVFFFSLMYCSLVSMIAFTGHMAV